MALTDTRLRNIKATGKRFEIPDRDGLVLRVSQRGRLTWAASFRVSGTGDRHGMRGSRLTGAKQRLTIGTYPELGLADARARVLALKGLARKGSQPRQAIIRERPGSFSVSDLIDAYAEGHLRRNLRSGANIEKLLRRHVEPRWGGRQPKDLRRLDLVALLEEVRLPHSVSIQTADGRAQRTTRGGPGAASEVRKWVIALFRFAVQEDVLPANPFVDVRNRDRQWPRDRVLSMDELAAISRWAVATPYPWGPFVQLLLLTGARRNEWASAENSWLDINAGRLEIPAASYKTGKVQVLPLSPQAKAILRSVPAPELGPYLFSTCGGLHPISGFSKVKRQLDTSITCKGEKLAHWTLHDLRRSMATHMERIGVQPHVIEVCLGHSLRGIGAVYRRYEYLPEKKLALQQWADELLRHADLECSDREASCILPSFTERLPELPFGARTESRTARC